MKLVKCRQSAPLTSVLYSSMLGSVLNFLRMLMRKQKGNRKSSRGRVFGVGVDRSGEVVGVLRLILRVAR